MLATWITTFASHAADEPNRTDLSINDPKYPRITELDARRTTTVFGTTFTETVLQLSPDFWQGTVDSALSWHMGWVESITPGSAPAFEEIVPDINSR